jgi:UDP-N-acetylmuramate dehydrogenase
MRVGGRVEWLLEPADPGELRAAYLAARERGFVPRILGGGANLIVGDGTLPGVVITTERMRRLFRPLDVAGGDALDPRIAERAGEAALVAPVDRERDPRLVAWAGATLPSLVQAAQRLGWSGLEGLVGVPGQIGGGVAMNAGGRWGELWDVIALVRVLDESGELRDLRRDQCAPRYRNGGLGPSIVVGAVLELSVSTESAVREATREHLLEKQRIQPVTEWSAGCIFKNPPRDAAGGRSAGRLIEEAGCKGLERGGAVVSPRHANFIVNRGTATAADVLGLIEEVRRRVADRTGLQLETEVQVWTAAPR